MKATMSPDEFKKKYKWHINRRKREQFYKDVDSMYQHCLRETMNVIGELAEITDNAKEAGLKKGK